MRKLIFAAALAAVLCLASCTAAKPGNVFKYQKQLSSVTGTWTENGTEYGVRLRFEVTEDGTNALSEISFTSPETLEGISFCSEGGKLTAIANDMDIPLEFAKQESVLRLSRLFSLKDEEITDISVKDEKTVTEGASADKKISFQVVCGKDGLPEKITRTADGATDVFKVKDIKLVTDGDTDE